MTIKDFYIEYDAINSKNIFTNGDTVNGRIILEVSKETKIQSLTFIGKGKARVSWTEHRRRHGNAHGPRSRTQHYWADEKYYEVQQHILREGRQDGSEIIAQGRHVFPFTFKIPDRKLPSSFKDHIGKIVHKVKAELRQSMKLTKKAQAYFTFVSKADTDIPGLMDPQYGCKDKSVRAFGSGNVSLDVHTKKMGYKQGETIEVTVEIKNNSSRSVKPKFKLYEKRSFFAMGKRKLYTTEVSRDKDDDIETSSGQKTVTKMITIPSDLPPSILSCAIIKLEYRLEVYLDIKYATDPEVKLPIVVLPKDSGTKKPPTSAGIGFEAFGNTNQPTWSSTPHQAAPQPFDPPPSYGAYPLYPAVPFDQQKTTF